MDIAELNVRITFQKNTVQVDKYGNHTSTWADYFTCWATCSGQDEEDDGVATTKVSGKMDFTVRYCSELAGIESDQYRITFDGRIYNIDSIDDMAFKRHSLKFHGVREK